MLFALSRIRCGTPLRLGFNPPICHATRFTRDHRHFAESESAPRKVPACIAIFHRSISLASVSRYRLLRSTCPGSISLLIFRQLCPCLRSEDLVANQLPPYFAIRIPLAAKAPPKLLTDAITCGEGWGEPQVPGEMSGIALRGCATYSETGISSHAARARYGGHRPEARLVLVIFSGNACLQRGPRAR